MSFDIDHLTTTATTITCGKCDIVFAVPERWYRARCEDHKTWYCPNGHPRVFAGKSETDKLRDELAREKRCCESNRARAAHLTEQVEHREHQIRGYKGALAKAKKARSVR